MAVLHPSGLGPFDQMRVIQGMVLQHMFKINELRGDKNDTQCCLEQGLKADRCRDQCARI